jgi:hypothetical protein
VTYGWTRRWSPVSITLPNPHGGSNPDVTIGYTDVVNDFS